MWNVNTEQEEVLKIQLFSENEMIFVYLSGNMFCRFGLHQHSFGFRVGKYGFKRPFLGVGVANAEFRNISSMF